MQIIEKRLSELKPYGRNPRKNDDAVEYVANSIREFGFKVPIVIDDKGTIVTGHTRYKAAKEIGLETVPCIIADDLTPEQIKAFRLADNKVAEKAEWDFDLLDGEISDLSELFDFSDFGFDFTDDFPEEEKDWNLENRERNISILNLEKANYQGSGKYDIPEILPLEELPEIKEWIGFNYVLSDDDPADKAVHFFLDDYQFLRVWNDPDRYLDKLRQYAVVASPDFSPYEDMPMATQIFNHYRKHWLARYWQDNGIKVVPTIRASADERCLEWFLDGEPRGGVILLSSMWMHGHRDEYFDKIYQMTLDTLEPKKILVYGNPVEGLDNVEYIDNFTKQRWRS